MGEFISRKNSSKPESDNPKFIGVVKASSVEDAMRQLKAKLEGKEDSDDEENPLKNKKEVKRIPIDPKWEAVFDEMIAMREELKVKVVRFEGLKRQFWGMVMSDTGLDEHMRFDDEKREIVIYEDKE